MRKFISAVMAAVLIICAAPAFGAGSTQVYINGKKVEFTEESGFPFVENGRTYVPLRAAMEAFGAEVGWDNETRSAIVRKAPVTVICKIGEKRVYRNGTPIENDAAALITGGRTYLPIRAVLEAFGAEVSWDGSVKAVTKEGGFIEEIESGGIDSPLYWDNWNAAMNYMAAGNYRDAIREFRQTAKMFMSKEQNDSRAMLFLHLGDCYSALGEYDNARMCYLREADYWKLCGDIETETAARRRASLISGYSQLYIKTSNPQYAVEKHFGKPFEPESGILLGACVPMDEIGGFSASAGKEHGAFLQYMHYGDSLKSSFDIKTDKIIQIHLQPINGLSAVKRDEYLIGLAKDMENSDVSFMLRFAGEMNDTSNAAWYDPDPSKFIEAFRTVSDVFHEYAPSVPVIWAPNFYPETNYEAYYPGDEYVDYVGVSSYKTYLGEVDPLGQGQDRSRWSSQLDTLYSIYGYKKPFIVVEGNAENGDLWLSVDRTDFAARQITDFYTYAPIRYPNLKMMFIYNNKDANNHWNFRFDGKSTVFDAYKTAIQNDIFLTGNEKRADLGSYYELGSGVRVEAASSQVCAYVAHPVKTPAYVIYQIGGQQAGAAYAAPYSAEIDFTSWKGQSVELRCVAYDEDGGVLTDNAVTVKVD